MGYAEDFKRFIEAHKDEHLLRRFKDLEKRLEDKPVGTVVEDGRLSVTLYRAYSGVVLFKVKYVDDIFFVKRETPESESIKRRGYEGHDALNELKSTFSAKEALEEIPGVEVVEFQMAFRDGEHGYFVSRWRDLPEINKELLCDDEENRRLLDLGIDLDRRMEVIVDTLNARLSEEERGMGVDFCDVEDNAFYDEERDTIVLFDLHKGSEVRQYDRK
jgi:hypothetical protein